MSSWPQSNSTDDSWSNSGSGEESPWSGGERGGGGGKPAWVSSGTTDSPTYEYLNLIGNPVLYFFMIVGLILAVNTARRRNIRKYSSAVYLSMLFFGDILWVTGAFLPDYAASLDLIHFNDKMCMYMQCFQLTGRVGTSFIIIMLALERILLLAKPARCVGLAKPRVALIISVMCMLSALGLSGFYMYGAVYQQATKKCGYGDTVGDSISPQSLYKITLISVTLTLALILSLVLAALMWRKRRMRISDPIQASIAAARQYTKQLNRINLISFMMILQFTLTNIPLLVGPSIYWGSVANGFINYPTAKLIAKIIDIIALFFIASRAYIVALASPKIRREAWLALRCQPDHSRVRQLGIDIRPKKVIKAHDVTTSSEDLLDSKNSSVGSDSLYSLDTEYEKY